MSVGTLHSIPISSHMGRILPEFTAFSPHLACDRASGDVQWRFPSKLDGGRARMLRHAPIAVAILLFGCIGCGGGSSKPDAGGLGGLGGGSGGNGLAGAGGPGTGGSVGGGAMPTGTRVLQGTQAALLDLGAPCTNEEGATGDRWCAIIA